MNKSASRKVSIIIPCYNKENFIDSMLKSVSEQIWDNIQLILVDDGSTDSTNHKIKNWLPVFKSRGYDVIFIEQENKGVSGAVYSGLLRADGDYVCQVDADDELTPSYVLTMASWLDNHPLDDFVVCDYINCNVDCNEYNLASSISEALRDYDLGRSWIQSAMSRGVWVLFSRMSYVRKIGIIDNFDYECRFSQEPSYAFPLFASCGKFHYIRQPLYVYKQGEGVSFLGGTTLNNLETFSNYYLEYSASIERIIQKLPISSFEKLRLNALNKMEYAREPWKKLESYLKKGCVSHAEEVNVMANISKLLLDAMPEKLAMDIIKQGFQVYNSIFNGKLYNPILYKAVREELPPHVRIVAWGVLGENGQTMLPKIMGTIFTPDILWDAAAKEDSVICGLPVSKPLPESLTKDDILIILVSNKRVLASIDPFIKNTPAFIVDFHDLCRYFEKPLYDQFPDLSKQDDIKYSDIIKEDFVSKETNLTSKLSHMREEYFKKLGKKPFRLHFLDFPITEKCSLNCRNCSNLTPYYQKPNDYDFEKAVKSLERILDSVDNVEIISLLGGEPFMNIELNKYLEHLKGLEGYNCIRVFTNGTILPDERLLKIMEGMRIEVFISNYGNSKQKCSQLSALLNMHDITNRIMNINVWHDFSHLEAHNRSDIANKQILSECCITDKPSISDDRLYRCSFTSNAARLGMIPVEDNFSVDLHSNASQNELREQIRELLDMELLKACNYCAGRPVILKRNQGIRPAVQTSQKRTYTKCESAT